MFFHIGINFEYEGDPLNRLGSGLHRIQGGNYRAFRLALGAFAIIVTVERIK